MENASDIPALNSEFEEARKIIEAARDRAYRKVNEELILMYRDMGAYISRCTENAAYGEGFVNALADFFADKYPDLDKATGVIITDLMYKHWDEWVTTAPHPFVADFDG